VIRILSIAIICLFNVSELTAQSFFKIQSTERTDSFNKEIVSFDNGDFATKEIKLASGIGGYSILISRFNKCKQLVWSRIIRSKLIVASDVKYNPNFNTPFLSCFSKSVDNSLLIAYTDYSIDEKCIFFKLNENGNLVWSKSLNMGSACKLLVSISSTQSKNGDFLLAGSIDSFDVGSNGFTVNPVHSFILDIRNNGSLKWSKSIVNDLGNSIKILSFKDNSFLVNNNFGFLFRFDSLGQVIWIKKASLDSNYSALWIKNIAIDDNDMIYCFGDFVGNNNISKRICLCKMDVNGKILWSKLYGDSLSNNIPAKPLSGLYVNVLSIDRIVLTATVTNYLSSRTAILILTDSNGNILKCKSLPDIRVGYGSSNGSGKYTYFLNNESYSTKDTGFIISGFGLNGQMIIAGMRKEIFSCFSRDTNFYAISHNPTFVNKNSYVLDGYNFNNSMIKIDSFKSKVNFLCFDSNQVTINLRNDTVICFSNFYTVKGKFIGLKNKNQWSTGDTGNSITVTKSGRYWLRVSHGYCTSTDTVNVIFRDQVKSGLVKKHTICPYDSVMLEVKDTLASYYWINPKKIIVYGRQIVAKDSGNYYLMLANTQNCSAVDTVHIGYYPLPGGTAGPDTLLCYNQQYTMQGAGGIRYQWIPAKYLSSATDPNAKAKLPNAELYTLIISNQQGCRDTSQVMIKVRPQLKVKASALPDTVCYNGYISLLAEGHGGDSLHYNFEWNTTHLTGNPVSINATASGWQRLILSDNCSPDHPEDSIYITVIPKAKAGFTFIPGNPVKLQKPVDFRNNSVNASRWLWTFSNTDSSQKQSPAYIYTDTGNYKVMLIAYGIDGCANDTAISYIKVIDGTVAVYIPNVFTPNGDGHNDRFEISGTGIKACEYSIYNRWGELIFSTTGNLAGSPNLRGSGAWDGNYKGAPVPEGVYIYTATITDIDEHKHYFNGNVTVSR
jgi:gliding motility-associated-like protein